MKIIPSKKSGNPDMPFKVILSFEAVFTYLEEIAENPDHILHDTANSLLEECVSCPELREGFDNMSLLFKYEKEIDKLLGILFPELLQANEIKAASIPFDFTIFKLSKRFQDILDKAGDDFVLKLRNLEESKLYIMACTVILSHYHGVNLDFKRPFFYDIPDKQARIMRHYRALINADFFRVKALEHAPEITERDVKRLLDNFEDIDLWKKMFPPGSYEFKGFGIVNLFDVTSEQNLFEVNNQLLQREASSFKKLEHSISKLFRSNAVRFGFSMYNIHRESIDSKFFNRQNSFLHYEGSKVISKEFFCKGISEKLFEKKEVVAISDLEEYAEKSQMNPFASVLQEQGFKSVILVPISLDGGVFGLMEIVSPNARELNSVNAYKLKDVIPMFEVATQRFMKDYQNKLESIIQEHYTSIHPTVKWKFYEEAEAFYYRNSTKEWERGHLKDIVFDQVMPLYGQIDVRNSSVIRNHAIQKDLIYQLDLAAGIIGRASSDYQLPIYGELYARIEKYRKKVGHRLMTGDEKVVMEFLQKQIHPIFEHLQNIDQGLSQQIEEYNDFLNDELGMVYAERRKFDESLNMLNEKLANFIDVKQEEAQNMFPHYFERYKTDGLEYNMYIGDSLVQDRKYHPVYLQNLRLWQLQMMCELENVASDIQKELEQPLDVASLILVHSSTLAIKFRMDEKRFDVAGAYNIRYEILKKRLDKVNVKGKKERLTKPGKISIVYSQKKDAEEYLRYVHHLQQKHFLLPGVEDLELEELQGISGLKALRVGVNYEHVPKDIITYNELLKVLES